MPAGSSRVTATRQKMASHQDGRFQHELKEMQQTKDLDQIDDDVELAATLLEWHAAEHLHRDKSTWWYVGLALGTLTFIGIFLALDNILGSSVVALAGGLLFYAARRPPRHVRYRLMADGVAMNNVLYHYKELEAFNIVYEPHDTKVVLIRGRRTFAPLIHLEIGQADPTAIRDILIEFLPENPDLEEPFADILSRRLGW